VKAETRTENEVLDLLQRLQRRQAEIQQRLAQLGDELEKAGQEAKRVEVVATVAEGLPQRRAREQLLQLREREEELRAQVVGLENELPVLAELIREAQGKIAAARLQSLTTQFDNLAAEYQNGLVEFCKLAAQLIEQADRLWELRAQIMTLSAQIVHDARSAGIAVDRRYEAIGALPVPDRLKIDRLLSRHMRERSRHLRDLIERKFEIEL